jgi:hypothetical protein
MDVFPPIESCPSCGSDDRLNCNSIPESTMIYKRGAVSHTDYMPAMLEYKCRNCDTKFLLMPEGTR